MSLTNILPSLKELSRQEKLQVIQFLKNELTQDELKIEGLENGKTYEVWSPYDAFTAAETLTKMLQEHSNNLENKTNE